MKGKQPLMWQVSSRFSPSLCFPFGALMFSDLTQKLFLLQPNSTLLCCCGHQFNAKRDAAPSPRQSRPVSAWAAVLSSKCKWGQAV